MEVGGELSSKQPHGARRARRTGELSHNMGERNPGRSLSHHNRHYEEKL